MFKRNYPNKQNWFKTYKFDPEVLHDIAIEASKRPKSEMFDYVSSELKKKYPKYITTEKNWMFNNAGGAMGQMTLLHGSITEYIIIFGSAIGTEGHSGRYNTEVYDFMMHGDMWCYLEGEIERTDYKPGDGAYLGKGDVKGYKLPEGAWMLEYARGPIFTMLPFGLADTMLSTLDIRTFFRTIWVYGKLTVKNLFLRGKV